MKPKATAVEKGGQGDTEAKCKSKAGASWGACVLLHLPATGRQEMISREMRERETGTQTQNKQTDEASVFSSSGTG